MFKTMQEDGIRACRLIMVAGVGLVAIGHGRDENFPTIHSGDLWFAYPHDDWAQRTGLVCWVGDSEAEVINSAREEGL